MGNYHVRFLGGKGAAMPPTYPINQNIIKVLTDKGDVDVPDMPIVEQNKYQSVTLAIPDGASYIQFTSEESTNTSGYRIDNVSLTGIAK